MDLSTAWEEVVTGERPSVPASLARCGLVALSVPYRAALAANIGVFDLGVLRRARLPCPVLSVGNLTLGGTGKTSATALVAQHLRQCGLRPAIILRGHGRADKAACLVSRGDGQPPAPAQARAAAPPAGDEATMLARLLPHIPVAVGKWRESAGRLLLEHTDANVMVLDDGFQYFRMTRDLDIVLLSALSPLARQRLFPGGRLREPLSHLRRAAAVWLTHTDLACDQAVAEIAALARQAAPAGRLAHARHRPVGLRRLGEDDLTDPARLAGRRIAALSSIGSPRAFELTLQRLGAAEIKPIRYPDHHAYVPADLDAIASVCNAADLLVTTEKDAVRLPQEAASRLDCRVLRCEMEIIQGAEQAFALIDEAARCPSARKTPSDAS